MGNFLGPTTIAFSERYVPAFKPSEASGHYMYHQFKVKVKCTLVQALRLCTGRTAHRGSRGITPFLTTALDGGEGSVSRQSRSLPPGKTRYPLYRRLGGAPGPVWTGTEKLASTGIRSPDHHQSNTQQFYVQPTHCIYVFCVDLRTNSYYFPIQH